MWLTGRTKHLNKMIHFLYNPTAFVKCSSCDIWNKLSASVNCLDPWFLSGYWATGKSCLLCGKACGELHAGLNPNVHLKTLAYAQLDLRMHAAMSPLNWKHGNQEIVVPLCKNAKQGLQRKYLNVPVKFCIVPLRYKTGRVNGGGNYFLWPLNPPFKTWLRNFQSLGIRASKSPRVSVRVVSNYHKRFLSPVLTGIWLTD